MKLIIGLLMLQSAAIAQVGRYQLKEIELPYSKSIYAPLAVSVVLEDKLAPVSGVERILVIFDTKTGDMYSLYRNDEFQFEDAYRYELSRTNYKRKLKFVELDGGAIKLNQVVYYSDEEIERIISDALLLSSTVHSFASDIREVLPQYRAFGDSVLVWEIAMKFPKYVDSLSEQFDFQSWEMMRSIERPWIRDRPPTTKSSNRDNQ